MIPFGSDVISLRSCRCTWKACGRWRESGFMVKFCSLTLQSWKTWGRTCLGPQWAWSALAGWMKCPVSSSSSSSASPSSSTLTLRIDIMIVIIMVFIVLKCDMIMTLPSLHLIVFICFYDTWLWSLTIICYHLNCWCYFFFSISPPLFVQEKRWSPGKKNMWKKTAKIPAETSRCWRTPRSRGDLATSEGTLWPLHRGLAELHGSWRSCRRRMATEKKDWLMVVFYCWNYIYIIYYIYMW